MEDSLDNNIQTPQDGCDQASATSAKGVKLHRLLAGNLPLIMALGGAMLLFYVMGMRRGPASAAAAPSAVEKNVESTLSALAKTASKPDSQTAVIDAIFQQVTARPPLAPPLERNPFVFIPPEGALPPPPPPPSIEEQANSPQRDEAMAALARLKLQSVLTGSNGAMAMINNNLLTAGQTISGWTVKEIGERHVVLVWKTERCVLKMSQ